MRFYVATIFHVTAWPSNAGNQMSLYAPDYQPTGPVLLERLKGRKEVCRVFLLSMIV
jgi:hypothetical protein